jgi:hypothetical protein
MLLASGVTLPLDIVEEVARDQNGCFVHEKGRATKIQRFSGPTRLFCRLLRTDSARMLTVSGIPMHRIKDTNPWLDSQSGVQALGHMSGQLLDTCTGLGSRSGTDPSSARSPGPTSRCLGRIEPEGPSLSGPYSVLVSSSGVGVGGPSRKSSRVVSIRSLTLSSDTRT